MEDEGRHLAEVLLAKRRRLRELEKIVARYGNDAPPHIVTERDDLQEQLQQDSNALEPVINGELSTEAMAALRAYGIPASVRSAMQHFEQRLYDLNNDFRQFRANQERIREDERKLREDERRNQERLREDERKQREERQAETDKQRDHVNLQLVRINLYVRITSATLFLIAVGGVVYFVIAVYFASSFGLGR